MFPETQQLTLFESKKGRIKGSRVQGYTVLYRTLSSLNGRSFIITLIIPLRLALYFNINVIQDEEVSNNKSTPATVIEKAGGEMLRKGSLENKVQAFLDRLHQVAIGDTREYVFYYYSRVEIEKKWYIYF